MRSLRNPLYLAWRALRASPGRAGALTLGVAVAAFLPLFTWLAGDLAQLRLMQRAESTPVVVGAPGSAFDLTLASLYFRGQVFSTIQASQRSALQSVGGLVAVPLHLGHRAGGAPVVGTSPEYLEHRGLSLARGRPAALLGELIAGAQVADALGLQPGDLLRAELDNPYDVAGATPLQLKVVGVLRSSGTPDDGALFVDVRTTWALDGALHGHQEVEEPDALGRDERNLQASPELFINSEVQGDDWDDFHLHGHEGLQPLSAVLVFPGNAKAHDLVLAQVDQEPTLQAARPVQVVGRVLDVLLRIQEGLMAYFAVVLLATLGMLVAVTSLSMRLRRSELELLRRMGSSPGVIPLMLGAELLWVLGVALTCAVGLSAIGLALLDGLLTG